MNKMIENLKPDAVDAAWRTAGSQLVKLSRDSFAAVLARDIGPGDEALRGKISEFLKTEVGTAMLTAMMSIALSSLPASVSPEVSQKLARELRIRSMTGASDILADVVMGPLREVIGTYLKDVTPPASALPPTPASLRDGNGISASVAPATAVVKAEKA